MKKLLLTIFCSLFILTGCSEAEIPLFSEEDRAQFEQTLSEIDTLIKDVEAISTEISQLGTSNATNSLAETNDSSTQTTPDEYDYVLIFPSDDYPETALHILGAIEQGHSDVCTIDREGADANRSQSLKGIPTKEGYDRDEWPMAMCQEGGKGASVAYIDPSDNRGAGSWVGHELSQYENGEKVLFIVEKPKNIFK